MNFSPADNDRVTARNAPIIPGWCVAVGTTAMALTIAFLVRHPPRQPSNPWTGYAHAHSDAGHALLQLGRQEDALAHGRKAVELRPDHAAAHNNLGNALMAAGDLEQARKHYTEALRLNPHFADVRFNLGTVWLKQERADEALVEFEATTRIQPAHPDAHYNLGFLHLGAGRLEQAQKHYTEAANLRPSHAATRNSLGLVLLQLGRTREAVESFEQALRLNEDLLSALNNLAWVLATAPDTGIRNASRALQLAQRAVKVAGPANPGVLKTLSAAYAEAGQFPQALETARQATRVAQENGAGELVDALLDCIRAFESGQPYRDQSIR